MVWKDATSQSPEAARTGPWRLAAAGPVGAGCGMAPRPPTAEQGKAGRRGGGPVTATLILHAGPHKTGTTALQQALVRGEDRLARLGILYPQTGRLGSSHAGLAEACRSGADAVLAALARETEGWRAVILSSENFSMLAPGALQQLRQVFPQAEVRVAYALRRLAALWPAHWAELVKHGQDGGFEGYLDRVAARDDTPWRAPVLPLRQLGRLEEVFGRDALRISVHEAQTAGGADIGPAFIDEMLGLGQEAPHFATGRDNLTASAAETALVRFLNLHLAGRARYAEKQQRRLALLTLLRHSPPDWLAAFAAAVEGGRQLRLVSAEPLVAAEERAVMDRYEDLLVDPPARYLEAAETTVPLLAPEDLPTGLRAALIATFDSLPAVAA